jgi:hypothetical protein
MRRNRHRNRHSTIGGLIMRNNERWMLEFAFIAIGASTIGEPMITISSVILRNVFARYILSIEFHRVHKRLRKVVFHGGRWQRIVHRRR